MMAVSTFLGTVCLIVIAGIVLWLVSEFLMDSFFKRKEELIIRMMKGEV